MRKIENAIVAAVAAGDLKAAHDHLRHLILHDRRRAWWAVFRVAAAQAPDDRREAMIALVGKTYVARRKGCLIGVDDGWVLCTLLRMAEANKWQSGVALAEEDRRLLEKWLPQRLRRSLPVPPNF